MCEATYGRALGSLLASFLLAAVALGLAMGARSPRRSRVGTILGICVGLLAVGVALHSVVGAGTDLSPLWVSLLGLVAIAIGARSIGGEERSDALAPAIAITGGLSLYAGLTASGAMAVISVLQTLPNADASTRELLGPRAASQLAPLAGSLVATPIVMLVGAAALAVWSISRRRPSRAGVVGAIAVVLTALGLIAVDVASMRKSALALRGIGARPWTTVTAFAPLRMRSYIWDAALPLRALLMPSGLATVHGRPIARFDRNALERPIARLSHRWHLPPPVEPFFVPSELCVAIDRRTSAADLRAFFDAASAAHIRAIEIRGERADHPLTAEQDRMRELVPMLGPLMDSTRGARALVGGRIDPSLPAQDRDLLHITVGSRVPSRAQTRPDSELSPSECTLGRPHAWRPAQPIYIAIGDGATGETLGAAIDRATLSHWVPVVVTGAIPGDPSRPMYEEPPAPTIRGALSREAVERVVAAHVAVRACYAREITWTPHLRGDLTVAFDIDASGRVERAAIARSTLRSPRVERCILEHVRQWTFAPPSDHGVVHVDYPYRFGSPE
jgi:TonB family protein